MSINEERKFVCNICGQNHFKHNMALKAHERFHNPEYRSNMSEKMKALRRDPNSKYNSPERREKLKAHWRDPEYRKNISEQMKAKRSNPDSNYNKGKIKNKNLENKPKEIVKEIVKFTNPQIKLYFKNYLKIHAYFDQKTIVKDYIREKYNGRQLQTNIQVYIEQSFDSLIQNYLEIEKIGIYSNDSSPIYRKIMGSVNKN